MGPALRDASLPGESSSEERIVARILAGEPALFELLMRRNNARLYRAIRSVVRAEDEVEELMQQTYLLAFAKLQQFSGRSSFSTWLIRIGLNEALQKVRHDRRWLVAVVDQLEEESSVAEETSLGPEQRLGRAELAHLLEQLVDELPPLYRTVFMLREVEELSTEETAEALGLSEDVVKQRLFRARQALRRALERSTGETLRELYPFEARRCDRVVAAVLERLPAGPGQR
jgi:RNA polymerase sigma-70 factor (ECF subfamily)